MQTKINYTEHLDGSECLKRRSMPRKSDIAKHWRDKIFDLGLFMDWGEPSCWACGIFDSSHDIEDSTQPLDEIFKVWDKQQYLERCHVVPRSLGGCNCHGNLVLLCKNCHNENPDTRNLNTFKLWLQNRKNYGSRRIAELTNCFEEFGLKLNNLDYFLMYFCDEFSDYLIENSILVAGKFTDASTLAALIEWKKDQSEDMLKNKLPDYLQKVIAKNS